MHLRWSKLRNLKLQPLGDQNDKTSPTKELGNRDPQAQIRTDSLKPLSALACFAVLLGPVALGWALLAFKRSFRLGAGEVKSQTTVKEIEGQTNRVYRVEWDVGCTGAVRSVEIQNFVGFRDHL